MFATTKYMTEPRLATTRYFSRLNEIFSSVVSASFNRWDITPDVTCDHHTNSRINSILHDSFVRPCREKVAITLHYIQMFFQSHMVIYCFLWDLNPINRDGMISRILTFESLSVLIRSSLSRIFPSDSNSSFRIRSSMAFSWFLSELILTISWFLCSSRSGRSRLTTSLRRNIITYNFITL